MTTLWPGDALIGIRRSPSINGADAEIVMTLMAQRGAGVWRELGKLFASELRQPQASFGGSSEPRGSLGRAALSTSQNSSDKPKASRYW